MTYFSRSDFDCSFELGPCWTANEPSARDWTLRSNTQPDWAQTERTTRTWAEQSPPTCC